MTAANDVIASEYDQLLDQSIEEILGLRRESLATFADRFWSKIDRSGSCWYWAGGTTWAYFGAIKINGRTISGRQIAWALVMGRSADGRLTATCRERACVRPHHMQEDGSARVRWAPEAKAGWPFEFREFAGTMMGTEEAEKVLLPALLYKGNLSLGRAQALFNLTLAAQRLHIDGSIDPLREFQRSGPNRLSSSGKIKRLTAEYPDLSHSLGLHAPLQSYDGLPKFWWRLADNPDILKTRPGLAEYVHEALARSANYVFPLDRISEGSYWSHRAWRRTRQVRTPLAPMPEVWPFVPDGSVLSDSDLIRLVDAAVPKSLPEQVRQDVCQDLILAVLEGNVKVDDLVGSVGEHTKAVFRQYPTKYGPLSLDAPAPWATDDQRTLSDTLADAPIILDGGFSSLADLRDRLRKEEAAA